MPDAAIVTSQHTCPAVTVLVPHVGGPVMTGSGDVLIGGLPAARVGDQCFCVGPIDKIAKGSSTVFINGKAAARINDPTEHGGIITFGVTTVLIGG